MAALDTNIIHANTRVRGLKSRLFTPAALKEFLTQSGGPKAMSDALLESPYRTEMAEALTRLEGADAIEEAASRNLTATFQYILNQTKAEYQELVRVFLGRWDLHAVKALLRCRHQGLEGDAATSALLPGPTLTAALLSDFATRPDMKSLVLSLAGWNAALCAPLRNLLKDYEANHDLAPLEEALDRTYFAERVERLRGTNDTNEVLLQEYLQSEIDRINLRLIFDRVQSAELRTDVPGFLPNGTLAPPILNRMAEAEDPAAAMTLLEETRYAGLVEELFQLMQTHRFSPIERYFERFIIKALRDMARKDIFGLGVVMNYAWLKYNEIINLRLIARGLAGNVPVGRVREELYFL